MDHSDIISHLPVEIKDKILTKLPIKDAVRTSVLSTKWRYTWTFMPVIVVKDDDLMPTGDRNAQLDSFHFVKNVDFLLFNHKGPILEFNLSTKYLFPEIFDRCILNLSTSGITHTFVLKLSSLSQYSIPSNFFLFDKLKFVNLSGCSVKLPLGIGGGFKLLRSLTLEKCTISATDLEWLVSSSPKLKYLFVKYVQVKDHLRIFSKGLRCLILWGDFPDIVIDAPILISLSIGFFNYGTSPARMKCINKFCMSLSCLVNLRQISLHGNSIQYLVDRSPAVLLNSCLKKLSRVILCVDLADQKESKFALSLLQIATNMRELKIMQRSGNTTSSSLWDKDIVFKSLQMVHIYFFKASEPALALVKFILSSAPDLRKLTLVENPKDPNEGNPEIFKRLLKFQRIESVVFDEMPHPYLASCNALLES